MRLTLHPGVWIGSASLLLTGGITLTTIPSEQTAALGIGYAAIALGILLLVWGIKWDGRHWWQGWSSFPERHKEKMLELADALAEMKSLVMHPGNWSRVNPLPHQDEHAARYQVARTRVDKIAEEIRYDTETRNTAVDFAQLCNMVVGDLLSRRDYREHLAELEKVSGPIFHRLHQGKGIKRSRISWPQWILDSDAEARERALAPPLEKPKPKSATEQATEYIERMTRVARTAGPMETSHPRVLADSKRLVRKLGERIDYVDEVLEKSDPAALRKWRGKIKLQRIPFDDLKADKLAALTDREREHVRIAVGELDELELLVDTLVGEPKRYRLAHAAGLYKHRAEKARGALQELVSILEENNAAPDEIRQQRRQLIAECRQIARAYDDSQHVFRTYIEPKPCYISLMRHFSPEFVQEVERSGRTAYSRGRGAGLPAMSQKLLRELDRLSDEWGLE